MSNLEDFELEIPRPTFRAHCHVAGAPMLPQVRALLREDVPEDRLFLFDAQVSNQNLDSYYTRMAESSLRNYAEDAAAGVAFLDTHSGAQRLGYSYGGEYDDEEKRVVASFYTLRGLQLGKLSTDNFIEGVQYGLIRDVSIGFKEGEGFRYTCSVCRGDIFSYDCPHIPGVEYDVPDAPDVDPSRGAETATCFAWVENARLSEVSAVYDGATPDAMIVKATREHRAGRLGAETQRFLETKHRIHLPRTKMFNGIDSNERETKTMANNEKPTPAPTDLLAREVAIEMRAAGVTTAEEADVLGMVRTLCAEVERLRPLEREAIEGRALRTALIDETLAEGVRAYGDAFNQEGKRSMLQGLDVDTIREMRSTWQAIGDASLPAGRRSQADPEAEGEEAGEEGDEQEAPALESDALAVEAVGGV